MGFRILNNLQWKLNPRMGPAGILDGSDEI
jgi:hypothetical protein